MLVLHSRTTQLEAENNLNTSASDAARTPRVLVPTAKKTAAGS